MMGDEENEMAEAAPETATEATSETAPTTPGFVSAPESEEPAAEAAAESVPEPQAAAEPVAEAAPEAAPDPEPAPAAAAEAAPAAGPKKHWYVVQVYSGYEQKVKVSLAERIRQADADTDFGEILIPTESVQEQGGRQRVQKKTFYPGYIFVQMAMTDVNWHIVRDTPKVTGFVGGRQPQPVPPPEIDSVVQQVEEGAAKPRPRVMFQNGDHVRVNDGAFANFTGTIEEVKPEKQKVRVLVSIFGRATPVELDYAQVEKTA